MKFLKISFLISAIPLLLFFSESSLASEADAISKNNAGAEKFSEEKYSEAYEEFVQGLAESPFRPEIHMNLGLTFEVNEELDKARSEYAGVIKNNNHPLFKFFAYFNLAQLEAKAGEIEKALALYQQALEIRPDSREVKTNIEMMINQQKQDQKKKDGKGKGDKKNDKKGKGEDDKKDDENKKFVNRREQKPKPFQSKKLSKKDVKKILEELKNQEQKIRAKSNKKKGKDKPNGKDW